MASNNGGNAQEACERLVSLVNQAKVRLEFYATALARAGTSEEEDDVIAHGREAVDRAKCLAAELDVVQRAALEMGHAAEKFLDLSTQTQRLRARRSLAR